MSNPINRDAVCSALGIPREYAHLDIFKALVSNGFLPAPLDSTYETYDITAVQAKVASASSIQAAAVRIATQHRGGQKAVF